MTVGCVSASSERLDPRRAGQVSTMTTSSSMTLSTSIVHVLQTHLGDRSPDTLPGSVRVGREHSLFYRAHDSECRDRIDLSLGPYESLCDTVST